MRWIDNLKSNWVELMFQLIPITFMIAISIYHAFGTEKSDFWNLYWMIVHHVGMISFAWLIGIYFPIISVRNIMYYLVIPYFTLKIFYNLGRYSGMIKGGEILSYIWGIICIILIIVCSILLWNKLRKTGS